MVTLVLIAEAATVLWFAAYLGVLADLGRSAKGPSVAAPDPAGRCFLGQARLAQIVGHSLLVLYLAAASLNLVLGLGFDLPL